MVIKDNIQDQAERPEATSGYESTQTSLSEPGPQKLIVPNPSLPEHDETDCSDETDSLEGYEREHEIQWLQAERESVRLERTTTELVTGFSISGPILETSPGYLQEQELIPTQLPSQPPNPWVLEFPEELSVDWDVQLLFSYPHTQ